MSESEGTISALTISSWVIFFSVIFLWFYRQIKHRIHANEVKLKEREAQERYAFLEEEVSGKVDTKKIEFWKNNNNYMDPSKNTTKANNIANLEFSYERVNSNTILYKQPLHTQKFSLNDNSRLNKYKKRSIGPDQKFDQKFTSSQQNSFHPVFVSTIPSQQNNSQPFTQQNNSIPKDQQSPTRRPLIHPSDRPLNL